MEVSPSHEKTERKKPKHAAFVALFTPKMRRYCVCPFTHVLSAHASVCSYWFCDYFLGFFGQNRIEKGWLFLCVASYCAFYFFALFLSPCGVRWWGDAAAQSRAWRHINGLNSQQRPFCRAVCMRFEICDGTVRLPLCTADSERWNSCHSRCFMLSLQLHQYVWIFLRKTKEIQHWI